MTPAERRQAASELAQYFLPKRPTQKKSRRGNFASDQYGFVVDPDLARELRDSLLVGSPATGEEAYAPRRFAKGHQAAGAYQSDPAIAAMPMSVKIRPQRTPARHRST